MTENFKFLPLGPGEAIPAQFTRYQMRPMTVLTQDGEWMPAIRMELETNDGAAIVGMWIADNDLLTFSQFMTKTAVEAYDALIAGIETGELPT